MNNVIPAPPETFMRNSKNYNSFDDWKKSLPFFRSKDYLYSLGEACYVAGKTEGRLQVENLQGRIVRLKPATIDDNYGCRTQAEITILDRIKMFIFNFFQSIFEGSRTFSTRVLEEVALYAYVWKEDKRSVDTTALKLDSSVRFDGRQEKMFKQKFYYNKEMRYTTYEENAAITEFNRGPDSANIACYWNYKRD